MPLAALCTDLDGSIAVQIKVRRRAGPSKAGPGSGHEHPATRIRRLRVIYVTPERASPLPEVRFVP